MGICVLVDELNRLRKSSSDSIDSEKSFDEFKRYMHIRRNVEDDLKSILREVRSSETKTLFLLCGSAGDGKSHMLSYLKNCDEEHLLDGFQIHNDATESSSPSKTAIETLNEVLDGFSDEKLEMPINRWLSSPTSQDHLGQILTVSLKNSMMRRESMALQCRLTFSLILRKTIRRKVIPIRTSEGSSL